MGQHFSKRKRHISSSKKVNPLKSSILDDLVQMEKTIHQIKEDTHYYKSKQNNSITCGNSFNQNKNIG